MFLKSLINIFLVVFLMVVIFYNTPSFVQGEYYENEQEKVQQISENNEIEEKRLIDIEKNIYIPEVIAPIKISKDSDFDLDHGLVAVLDENSNELIFSREAFKITSIASITKLITALTFLDTNPNWESIYEITDNDRVEGGKIYLYKGEKVTIKDLLYTSLIASANTATMAMVHSTGLEEAEFVKLMNDKMIELGFVNTKFIDPIGLDPGNVSTAREIAKIAKLVFARTEITDVLSKDEYIFETLGKRKKIIETTNWMLKNYDLGDIKNTAGKTGFIEQAGYCFVGEFSDKRGNKVISVFLDGNNINDRFDITEKLVKWTYDNYLW